MAISAKENFEGYMPVGVCIMSHDYLAVISIKILNYHDDQLGESGESQTRLSTYNMGVDGLRWVAHDLKSNWDTPRLVHTNLDEFLITDDHGWIFYMGLGDNKAPENDLPISIPLYDITNIDGRIFGVSVGRTLLVRNGPNDWEEIDDMYERGNSNQGFLAVDGFSEREIYMAGRDRDVWRYNYPEREWQAIDIGVDGYMPCESICCAEGGNVYIGGKNGMLAWGRGDKWQHKRLAISSQTIMSIVSFKGRVFLGTPMATYVLDEDFVAQPFDFDGQLSCAGGHLMYAAHGMMIIANNSSQVALYDGNNWVDLHNCGEMTAHDLEIKGDMEQVDAAKLLKNLQDLNNKQ